MARRLAGLSFLLFTADRSASAGCIGQSGSDEPNHKAEALRQAQLELIGSGRFAHPFYWAPFVLVGQP